MCLVVFAWNPHAGRRLALVGNRDEFHARAAAPMGWWREPALLAGRDLVAGGTWLGVDAAGRFGVLTNFRGAPNPPSPPSRGTLIPRFLAGDASPSAFLAEIARSGREYAGFSLLVGDATELAYLSNADASGPQRLEPGVYGLSNGLLDSPWPKVTASRARLEAHLSRGSGSPEELLDLLGDRNEAPDEGLPDTGIPRELERRLSAPFIVGEGYGTRATSVLLLDGGGRGTALERTHGSDGRATGLRRFTIGSGA